MADWAFDDEVMTEMMSQQKMGGGERDWQHDATGGKGSFRGKLDPWTSSNKTILKEIKGLGFIETVWRNSEAPCLFCPAATLHPIHYETKCLNLTP